MKISKLPAPVIDRLDLVARHADMLAQAALLAERKLSDARDLINGKRRDADHQVLLRAQSTFQETREGAQAERRRADQARRVASGCKAFVDQLPADAAIDLLPAPRANGVDLDEVRGRIAKLRGEIAKINNTPLPAPDIRARVEAYVDHLAHCGRPLLRGFHAGGELHVSWPMAVGADRKNGNGFDDRQANSLLMEALLRPGALVDYLLAAIAAETDALMPVSERGPRLADLEDQLAQLQLLEATFVDRAIENGATDIVHDPATPPATILGVRVVTNTDARERRELVS